VDDAAAGFGGEFARREREAFVKGDGHLDADRSRAAAFEAIVEQDLILAGRGDGIAEAALRGEG